MSVHPWQFAVTRFECSSLSEETIKEQGLEVKGHYFPFPGDFVRLLEVELEDDAWRYELHGIVASVSSVVIRYISDAVSLTSVPPYFNEVLRLKLAVECGMALRCETSLVQSLFARYEKALEDARYIDVSQNIPRRGK